MMREWWDLVAWVNKPATVGERAHGAKPPPATRVTHSLSRGV